MIGIIDRFEGNTAVIEIENGKTYNMDKELLPDAKEGSKITITVEEPKVDEDTYSIFKRLLKD